MDCVGHEQFCAVSSDNTGNTCVVRQILAESIKTILNLPDPIHLLNRTILDIIRLPYFAKVGVLVLSAWLI